MHHTLSYVHTIYIHTIFICKCIYIDLLMVVVGGRLAPVCSCALLPLSTGLLTGLTVQRSLLLFKCNICMYAFVQHEVWIFYSWNNYICQHIYSYIYCCPASVKQPPTAVLFWNPRCACHARYVRVCVICMSCDIYVCVCTLFFSCRFFFCLSHLFLPATCTTMRFFSWEFRR